MSAAPAGKPRLAVASSRSAERERLRVVIERRDAAAERVRDALAARQRAAGMVEMAKERLALAEADVEREIESAGQRLAYAARHDADAKPDRALRDARVAVSASADDVAATMAALKQLDGEIAEPRAELDAAQRDVSAAVDGVLRSLPYRRLVDEALELRAALAQRCITLRYLLGAELVPADQVGTVWHFLVSRQRDVPGAPALRGGVLDGHVGAIHSSTEVTNWDAHALTKQWQAARGALASDADVVLPSD